MADDPRAVLEQAVKGRSDEEIQTFVSNLGGAQAVLDLVFEGMTQALKPEAAQDCVIGWQITEGETVHNYRLEVKDKAATVTKDEPADARVTLGLPLPDFLRLISGELDGMQAFMQGKLKLQGDMMFAQQMQTMFGV
jgi:putative sterol carrier protein